MKNKACKFFISINFLRYIYIYYELRGGKVNLIYLLKLYYWVRQFNIDMVGNDAIHFLPCLVRLYCLRRWTTFVGVRDSLPYLPAGSRLEQRRHMLPAASLL